MVNKCCVHLCSKVDGDNTFVKLHSFPKDESLKVLWMEKCSLKKHLVSHRVCHKHFKPENIKRNGRLSYNAIPSLHLNNNELPNVKIEIIEEFRHEPIIDNTLQHLFKMEGDEFNTNNVYEHLKLEKEVVIEESKPESICDSTDSIVLPVPKMEKDEFNKNHVIECPLSNILIKEEIIEMIKEEPCIANVLAQYMPNLEQNKSINSNYEYECTLSEKSMQRNHKIIHNRGERLYKCDMCSETFSRKNSIRTHIMITHMNVKSYSCNICSKKFAKILKLKIHMRIHLGEKEYLCCVCSKTFTRRDHLKIHMTMHSGEKRFMCSVCSKCFSRKDSLRCHLRIHSGEKPYSCNVCFKRFPRSDSLKIHKRYHTGEKPYLCKVCSTRFSHSSHFKSHLRTHTKEKLYQCPVCLKNYSRFSYIKVHMKIHARKN